MPVVLPVLKLFLIELMKLKRLIDDVPLYRYLTYDELE
jgi:hypothetical protein